MGKNVLLTGATGFLGSYVLPALLSQGNRVIALVRSSSDISRIASCADQAVFVDIESASLERIMSDNHVDTVIHLACDQGHGSDDLEALLAVNVTLGIKLLQAARKCKVQQFLNADTQLEAGVSAYALSKKQFAAWLPYFSGALAIANLRMGNIYGPGEPSRGFLPWLLGEFARHAEQAELTSGEQLRDFVHAADVSSAILAILAHAMDQGLVEYDVGSGELLSLRTFVETARDVFQEEVGEIHTLLAFGALQYRRGEVMRPQFDTAALFALDWRPALSLKEGLRDTVRALLPSR